MASKFNSDRLRKSFWPKIDGPSDAVDAMKLGQWAGLLIAIGYGFALVLAVSTDQYSDGTPFEDEAELYGIAFIYVVLMLIALLFWFLARRGMGWAVLIISVWGLFEAVLKLLTLPGQGIILVILMILFSIGGIRGWLGVRKYGRPGEQPDEASVTE